MFDLKGVESFNSPYERGAMEVLKRSQKRQITNVIAPEHISRHRNHETNLKNEEEILIEQVISHCNSFRSKFLNSAKGDWVKSAITKLDEISKELENIKDE